MQKRKMQEIEVRVSAEDQTILILQPDGNDGQMVTIEPAQADLVCEWIQAAKLEIEASGTP